MSLCSYYSHEVKGHVTLSFDEGQGSCFYFFLIKGQRSCFYFFLIKGQRSCFFSSNQRSKVMFLSLLIRGQRSYIFLFFF